MRALDIPQVIDIEQDVFSDPWPKRVFLDDLYSEYSYPFVVECENTMAGYAILWMGYKEGHLTNIAVAKKFQRKSIAKRLLKYILELAAELGLEQVLLEVRPSNAAAISLYETFGFSRLAIRKNYYHSPVEDCLVMVKSLAS